MLNWVLTTKQYLADKNIDAVVIISVINTKGSTPCVIGNKIIYAKKELFFGTIGGGKLEYLAINQAQKITKPTIKDYSLGPTLGQCCGGVVTLLFEYIDKKNNAWIDDVLNCRNNNTDFILTTVLTSSTNTYQTGDKCAVQNSNTAINSTRATNNSTVNIITAEKYTMCYETFNLSSIQKVVICGAGHIARALIPVIKDFPVAISLIDDRTNELQKYTKYHNYINTTYTKFDSALDSVSHNAYYLIMTYSHQIDFKLCQQILESDNFSYIGVIGSKTKNYKFKTRLQQQGLSEATISKLHCPIGKKYNFLQNPAAIAVSLATHLLEFLENNYQQQHYEVST